jgi:hypothetical protein
MIMRLMELEFLLQYFASATNALQISKVQKPQVRNYCWFNLFACQIRSRSIPTRKRRSCEIVKSLALHHVHIALLAPLTIYFKQTKNKVALSFTPCANKPVASGRLILTLNKIGQYPT